jgi:hypothetical protein
MTHEQPACFGDLEQVFPMTADGLRHSPDRCLACSEKTLCLKAAVAGNNQVVMAGEKLDRIYNAGNMSFLQRWSQKKILHHQTLKKQAQSS